MGMFGIDVIVIIFLVRLSCNFKKEDSIPQSVSAFGVTGHFCFICFCINRVTKIVLKIARFFTAWLTYYHLRLSRHPLTFLLSCFAIMHPKRPNMTLYETLQNARSEEDVKNNKKRKKIAVSNTPL